MFGPLSGNWHSSLICYFIICLSLSAEYGYERYKILSIQYSYLGDDKLGDILICV